MNHEVMTFTGDNAPTGRPAELRRRSRRMLRYRLYCAMAATDAIAILVSFTFARVIYPLGVVEGWLELSLAFLTIYFGAALAFRAYSVSALRSRHATIDRAVKSLLIAGIVVIVLAFALKASTQISRLHFGVGFAATFALLPLGRLLLARLVISPVRDSIIFSALLYEGAIPADTSAYALCVRANRLVELSRNCPLENDRLAQMLDNADRVVVACARENRLEWVNLLKGLNIQSEIMTPELCELAPLALGRAGTMPTVVVARGPLDMTRRATKRAFDLAVAGSALIFLAPLMILVAIAIKADSRGPVFFVQTRIGQNNRLFRMYKFRSMRIDRCDAEGAQSTARDDNRVTYLGNFIRAASIDELPQLLNVLVGDMSIVGPRPHALGSRAADKLFWEVDRRYFHRHAAKPGLTGLAQVRGHRGATRFESDLTDRLQADLEYLNDWTIWSDIRILLMTLRVMVHRNAY